MATCYDCIHCKACSDAGDSGFSSLKEDVSKCKHFKNKVDFEEVVRCKDCGAYLEYSHCEYMGLNGFCSLGFRTPKERGGEK